jgi:hypothetical protein
MEGITAEPQARAGILREIMASLASGQLPVPQESSRMVFEKHPAPWIGRFFADLEGAELAILPAARRHRTEGSSRLNEAFTLAA